MVLCKQYLVRKTRNKRTKTCKYLLKVSVGISVVTTGQASEATRGLDKNGVRNILFLSNAALSQPLSLFPQSLRQNNGIVISGLCSQMVPNLGKEKHYKLLENLEFL